MARHRPHLLVRFPDGGGPIELDAETVRHLNKVLRIESAEVTYTDGKGLVGVGRFREGRVERGDERTVPAPPRLTIAVSPPHSANRVRFLVEKLAELAVTRLVWLATARTEGRSPRPEKAIRWAAAALEQSRGGWLMDIAGPLPLTEVAQLGEPLFADAGGASIESLPRLSNPVLCVGPEGGFAPDEIPASSMRLSLGNTVLRVETAAIAGAILLRNVESRIDGGG